GGRTGERGSERQLDRGWQTLRVAKSAWRVSPAIPKGHETSGPGCRRYKQQENAMVRTNWKVSALATLFALAVLCAARAEDVKPTDEGKGADFKGKTFEMKDKDEVAFLLSFEAGKEFEATTKGDKDTDVNLYVYDPDGKEVGKDVTPGPKCSVKVTPAKEGKYKLLVKNDGGPNSVTLEVKGAK